MSAPVIHSHPDTSDSLDTIESDLLTRGSEARQRGDYAAAAQLFGAAASLATSSRDRLHHLLRQVPCLTNLGRHDEANEIVQRVLAEARVSRDLPALVDALGMQVDYYLVNEQPARVISLLAEALYVAEQLPQEPAMYQVIHNLAATLANFGLMDQALEHYDRALRLATNESDRQCCYANMAAAYMLAALRASSSEERTKRVHDGLYVATAALDPQANEEVSSRATALAHRALLLCEVGHHASALDDAKAGKQLAIETHDGENLTIASIAQLIAVWNHTHDIAVLDECPAVYALAVDTHETSFVPLLQAVEVDALWAAQRFDDARRVLQGQIDSSRRALIGEAENRGEHVHLGVEHLRVEALSESDPLTGLHNRRFLDHCIPEALADDAPSCIAVVDLDGFKAINDTFGYVTGDLVLQEAATLLERVCRRGDSVARLGGDEFVMVLRNTSVGDALHVFERVRQLVSARCWSPLPREYRLTASIGITAAVRGVEPVELLTRATDAMRTSKREGRDRLTVH